jgi:predicted acetyltransferase
VQPLTFRKLADDELRSAGDLFCQTVHSRPPSDEIWAYSRRSYQSDRTFGAFDGDTLVGTTYSWDSALTVPGGRMLPMAAVTRVGVRTDHTRRGALTGLMRRQLASAADADMVFAGLLASEPVIYGRFGFGIATLSSIVRIRRPLARVRPEAATSGVVRLLSVEDALAQLPKAYAAMLPGRPGMIDRSDVYWALGYERRMRGEDFFAAAHYTESGVIDGCVLYDINEPADPLAGATLSVVDFQAANEAATNDLWRFLLGVDLVDEVVVYGRPVDDPIQALLVNGAAARCDVREDALWIRLVDVPAALAARPYDGDPVVIEVRDPLLDTNSGRYRVSPHGTERTEAAAELTMDVDVLAMLYLGAWRATDLVGAGRITAVDPTAAARADRLFAHDRQPWSGTFF